MDIFNIQALIEERRVVKITDIDPATSYAQIGVFQTNNRPAGAANPNTYRSYAIALSELGGAIINNKNFIGVDPVYGNDAQAVTDGKYNPNSPFKSIDVAVTNAAPDDVILLYPGTHNTFGINSPLCSFYGLGGSIISNPYGGSVFNTEGLPLVVTGDAVLSNVNGPVINAQGAVVDVKCKAIISSSIFYAGLYIDKFSKATVTCDVLDTRQNFGNSVVVDGDSELIINANEVRYSWVGYIVGSNARLIANVAKNIQHNLVGDSTSLGNTCVLVANGAANALAKINGDLYDEKTIDPASGAGGALNFQKGASGAIILNGHRSYVKQIYALRNANCPNGEIIVNSEIINQYVNAFGGPSGMGAWMDAGIMRLRNKLRTAGGAPTDPCITLAGGTLILDGAVIIANAGAESIAAPAPITYKCYSGYTNNAPNANATNAIAGTTLVVDPLVQ